MRIDARENERIEFKEAVNDNAVKTVAAFANSSGGKIYIGVSDDGGIVGLEDVDAELLKLTDKMRAGDSFETHISMRQDLTFDYATAYFAESELALGEPEMRTLGMLTDGGYTNLALLLSDQCPSFVKAASFDDDSRDIFLEREEYSGSILEQLERAYDFLEAHNRFKTSYEGLRRVDHDDYPKQALREAVANAVAHREYALSGPTLVSVMPSSVEITSLGGLVPGIAPEDLEANISMPRNKLLAALMYRLRIIEAWGTGIGRMRSSYGDAAESVKVSVTPNTFSVTLPNRNARKSDIKPESDEEAIVEAIRGGCRTRAEIQSETGFSQSKTINLLRSMASAGILRKEGASRNTRYALM